MRAYCNVQVQSTYLYVHTSCLYEVCTSISNRSMVLVTCTRYEVRHGTTHTWCYYSILVLVHVLCTSTMYLVPCWCMYCTCTKYCVQVHMYIVRRGDDSTKYTVRFSVYWIPPTCTRYLVRGTMFVCSYVTACTRTLHQGGSLLVLVHSTMYQDSTSRTCMYYVRGTRYLVLCTMYLVLVFVPRVRCTSYKYICTQFNVAVVFSSVRF